MAKITRYSGNLAAFASNSTDDHRLIFGTSSQSDDLTDNVNATFLLGWEFVGVNTAPAMEDFNALGFTTMQFIAYLHQMGIAEWDVAQEYPIGACTISSNNLYISLANSNIGNAVTDITKWQSVSYRQQSSIQTTDATPTAIATIPMPTNTVYTVTATITGIKSDYSAACGGTVVYTARRVTSTAVEVAAPSVVVQTDSTATIDADVATNNIRILVTGVAAETWNFTCSYIFN